ncbi:hypothetical protein NliqN6_5104 [Naganishia liquefaciens]|uniref:Calcium uniporter protein, mitochondrial n=1 Tax=Naganishia liquefaciens TaxID=104408 RepID=A0A8H3TX13_9TREE|nr:hypothetical protein NliqN6_5104 [Naganishia liquefaciens]
MALHMWAVRTRSIYASRCAPLRSIPAPLSRQRCNFSPPRWYGSSPVQPGSREASSDLHAAAIDAEHAEFVSEANSKAPFQVGKREGRGHEQRSLGKEGDGTGTASTAGQVKTTGGGDPSGPNMAYKGIHSGALVGKLSPTSSHLIKLVVPLPPSLHAALDVPVKDSASSPAFKVVDTAFLLHPSQPLSHVSRLILGSLPAAERDADVEFRAVSGSEHSAYPASQSQTSEESEDNEGGPLLYERNPEGDDMQEVRWSTSTDLGDFIKQATLAKHFRIVLKPSWASSKGDTNPRSQSAAEPELSLKIMIPSFDSRTRYLRKRLLFLTREIAQLTQKKKDLDKAAHKGARRIAVGGLLGLVGYWGVVFKLTFFTPNVGWDVMEPVTYLSGLSTLICSYLFFLYHNREVSYSSVLDLSVSARQKILYEKAGLNIDRWTDMVSEAKGLRREIERVAQDYDYDWKGQLESLESDKIAEPSRASEESSSSTDNGKAPMDEASPHNQKTVKERTESIQGLDIDATIDEAAELERQTRLKDKQRNRGKGSKGEVSVEGKGG